LASLEVALLSLFFFSLELNLIGYLWIFFVLGMLLCPPFAIACEFHARNVDVWRIHIVKLVSGTDVEEAFKDGKYRWIPLGKAGYWGEYFLGHWFERILVFIMLIIWWLIGLQFFPRPLTVAFAILVTLCWGAYVFRLIEPRGEIIPYLHKNN
jgi:hypothetical protein